MRGGFLLSGGGSPPPVCRRPRSPRPLLPASKTGARRQRGPVTVRFGLPVRAGVVAGRSASVLDVVSGLTAEAHDQVITLAARPSDPAAGPLDP